VGPIAARSAARQAATVTSTLAREVQRGALGEAEHLSGAIIGEGLRLGVPTPAHERAMGLLRRLAATPGGNAGRPELAAVLLQR
jgi:ketopantoate reductase